MTPESQRIAIAEACGWTDMARTDKAGYYHGCLMGNHDYGHLQPVPDYMGDLNAMHEAEKVLNDEQRNEYQVGLANIVAKSPFDTYGHWSDVGSVFTCHATAAQRAEAFLKCLVLWKEEAQIGRIGGGIDAI